MSDLEVLIPEKDKIIIGGKTYYIGIIGITQQYKLRKLIKKILTESKDKLKVFAETTANTSRDIEDFFALLELLTPEEHAELFSIILKEDNIKFLDENLGLTEQSAIINSVCKYNKFNDLKKNILQIQSLFKQKT